MLTKKVKDGVLSLRRHISTTYQDPSTIEYNDRAVSFTRVSTNKQLKNFSLEIQLNAIENYAKQEGITIVEQFGGTNESAKDTNGKEFNRMLRFAKNPKNEINNILVFNFTRFSRSGEDGILAELRDKYNIRLIDVVSPMQVRTAQEKFIEKQKFNLGWLDNEIRRENIVRGMKASLQKGYWPCKSPLGYSKKEINGVKVSVPNDQAHYIRLAFEKRAEGLPINQIVELLKTIDFHTTGKALSQILMNPFYCGIIQHGLLGLNELVIGRHQPLVTQEIFLRCHTNKGRTQKKKDLNYLLKNLPYVDAA